MATLIPALGSCAGRMTPGERQLAQWLEQKLGDDYLLWYGLPLGPQQLHCGFVLLHPRRGLLMLEVRDWLAPAILRADHAHWEILVSGQPTTVICPMAQVRQSARQVADTLERDPALVQASGPHQGQLAFPWSSGVVFPQLTRAQFTASGLGQVLAPHCVICGDEMSDSTEPRELQSRLWDMFPLMMSGVMTPAQRERVRWSLFPELRLPPGTPLDATGDAQAAPPGTVRLLDLPQERLARSLGEGHRVIHGVAGSGKTLILSLQAQSLAQSSAPNAKPILILCYHEPLAVRLALDMASRGLQGRVQVHYFHRWCRQQLLAFGQTLHDSELALNASTEALARRVIGAVADGQIPAGQYQAVLIDEGHDFAPAWLQLAARMLDPATPHLLVLCDGAQSRHPAPFSLKSAGIEAQGRTALLQTNYRNPAPIFRAASQLAAGMFNDDAPDDDGLPRLRPVSASREDADPQALQILRLPDLAAQAATVAELLGAAARQGHAWGQMAVIGRDSAMLNKCASALQRRALPHQVYYGVGTFHANEDSIKLLTLQACRGLDFAVVALVGVDGLPAEGQDELTETQLLYGAATRATHQLIITISQAGPFSQRLLDQT